MAPWKHCTPLPIRRGWFPRGGGARKGQRCHPYVNGGMRWPMTMAASRMTEREIDGSHHVLGSSDKGGFGESDDYPHREVKWFVQTFWATRRLPVDSTLERSICVS